MDFAWASSFLADDVEYTNIPLLTVHGHAGVRAVLETFSAGIHENEFLRLRKAEWGPVGEPPAGSGSACSKSHPETAPFVRRLFELFDAGVSCRSIANRLEAAGLPSPGEIGPTRHPRSAGVWSGSAGRL